VATSRQAEWQHELPLCANSRQPHKEKMMSKYEVVADIAEIAKLNMLLAKQLNKTFKFKETREITYPSGHFPCDVYFEKKTGENIRAWAHLTQTDKLMNFILSGEPGATNWLEITVQLNFPASTFNRRMAGVFVKDSNGDVFLAHRGKLTKGNAGLHKEKVLDEFSPWLIEAEDGLKHPSRLILITSLDDIDIADRLCEFAIEARKVATKLGDASAQATNQKTTHTGSGNPHVVSRKPKGSPATHMLKLRKYFDEYAGIGHTKGHGGGRRTVEHGDIVKALEAHLSGTGDSQKAQAIDLAVISHKHINLYEVKTSARTTDVYTGVGQLLIHGECISKLLSLPVRRYLVLPDRPNILHEPHIVGKGGMHIVTFQKANGSYSFTGT
jgi:hypothetical protein